MTIATGCFKSDIVLLCAFIQLFGFRLSVRVCVSLSVCIVFFFAAVVVVARFFVAPFVLVALKRLLQFEQLAD